jgi:hypothetical protein
MARVTVPELQAWVEGTKFTIVTPLSATNTQLLLQIEEEILSRVANAYDTSTWVDETTTPRLIRVAIAKKFVAWAYRRQYSESLGEDDATYAALLEANSEMIIQGILDGSIEIPDLPPSFTTGLSFYPTDASSALSPTPEDPSLGPEKFSMGMTF